MTTKIVYTHTYTYTKSCQINCANRMYPDFRTLTHSWVYCYIPIDNSSRGRGRRIVLNLEAYLGYPVSVRPFRVTEWCLVSNITKYMLMVELKQWNPANNYFKPFQLSLSSHLSRPSQPILRFSISLREIKNQSLVHHSLTFQGISLTSPRLIKC